MKHKEPNKCGAGMPRGKTQSKNQTTRTDNLQEQVKQVFALQPHIAQYIPGSGSTPVSAEALAFCWWHEMTTWQYGARPLVTAADLKTTEERVRVSLAGPPDDGSNHLRATAMIAAEHLGLCCGSSLASAPSDRDAGVIRIVTAAECLLPRERPNPVLSPNSVDQLVADSLWQLEVRDRPDLTALKRHILKLGGKHFVRNDYLAAEIGRAEADKLRAEGTCRYGEGAQLEQMEGGQCHENALVLVCGDGVELWTGFALQGEVWVPHSWCVQNSRIVETTGVAELYYGVHVPMPFRKLMVALRKKVSTVPTANLMQVGSASRPTRH
jgi:hypothetical protein